MNNLDLEAKYKAFGWQVLRVDGNDMSALTEVIKASKALLAHNKPVMVLMKTEMGAGVDFMMHSHKWHGVAPNDEQLAAALGQLEETLGDY